MSIEINCKDIKVEDIMRDVKEKSESVIYGGWHVVIGTPNKHNEPIIKFINLDSLTEDEQHELLRNLDVMKTQLHMHNSYCSNNPIFTSDIFTIRRIGVLNSLYQQVLCEIKKDENEENNNKHVIIDLQKQIIKECQRKENKAKKIEDVYSKMSNDELKNELEALNEWKNHYETNLNEYEPNVWGLPTWVKNFEHALQDTKSKIDMINKILAYRELKESSMRGKKFTRYNNLEVEELEMILDALNVKCTLRKCELHKCEDNCESREIKKATNEILDNMKIIKDVLKCKKSL